MKIAAALGLPLLLAACASTSERGWTAQGAEPFDAASSACHAATDPVDVAVRPHEFEACMAEHGWRRP